jgi:hypothetical protein
MVRELRDAGLRPEKNIDFQDKKVEVGAASKV